MIGIDIVSIARMRTFVEKFGIKALRRFLSNDEIALCLKQSGQPQVKIDNDILDSKICLESALPYHHTSIDIQSINIARIAGFWAAKEACAKALGVGIGRELGFLDICINKNSKNAPYISISDKKKAYFGFNSLALSISHDGGFAIAAVICV